MKANNKHPEQCLTTRFLASTNTSTKLARRHLSAGKSVIMDHHTTQNGPAFARSMENHEAKGPRPINTPPKTLPPNKLCTILSTDEARASELTSFSFLRSYPL